MLNLTIVVAFGITKCQIWHQSDANRREQKIEDKRCKMANIGEKIKKGRRRICLILVAPKPEWYLIPLRYFYF
jgi:hypothetical protein